MGSETWCVFNSLTKRVRVNAHRFSWTLSGLGSVLNPCPPLTRLLWWALNVSCCEEISPSKSLWRWLGKSLPSIISWEQRSMQSSIGLFFTCLFHGKLEGILSVTSSSPLWEQRNGNLSRKPGEKERALWGDSPACHISSMGTSGSTTGTSANLGKSPLVQPNQAN